MFTISARSCQEKDQFVFFFNYTKLNYSKNHIMLITAAQTQRGLLYDNNDSFIIYGRNLDNLYFGAILRFGRSYLKFNVLNWALVWIFYGYLKQKWGQRGIIQLDFVRFWKTFWNITCKKNRKEITSVYDWKVIQTWLKMLSPKTFANNI